MPTDAERREYPHLSDQDWKAIEGIRARKAKGEWPFAPAEPGPPSFEDEVLAQLRQQTELLREIRDRLGRGRPD